MFRLNGYTALVTGATGGIGGAIVHVLHEAGANVVASGTNLEYLAQLQSSFTVRLKTLSCDLSNAEETEVLLEKAEASSGSVDIVVCNAGITRDNIALRMKDEEWERVLNINLSSVFRINRAAIKKMVRRRYGRIINISSVVGLTGNFGQANYSAAKAGIIGLTKSLALEVATRNITVNCIAPGFIKSAMTNILSEDTRKSIEQKIPLGYIGSPQDVAHAVLFLAAKESSYITGSTIHVNGGMLMC